MGLEAGWVYVLSNVEQFNNELRVKIGYGQDPYVRQDDLDTTGVSHPFKVEYAALVMNPRKIEQAVHSALSGFRCRKEREFFDCGVHAAVDRIKKEAPKIYEEKIHFVQTSGSEELKEALRLRELQGFALNFFKKFEYYEDHNSDEKFYGYLIGSGDWLADRDFDPEGRCSDQSEIKGYRDAWKDFEKFSAGSKKKKKSLIVKWQDFLRAGSEISRTTIFSSGFGKPAHFQLLKKWIYEDFQSQINWLIEEDLETKQARELEERQAKEEETRLAKEYEDDMLREWKREENARIASIDLENALALGSQKAIEKARKALGVSGAMSVSQNFSKVVSQNTTTPIYSNSPSNALLSSMRNAAEIGYEQYLQRTINEQESYQSTYEQIEPVKKVAPTVTYKRRLSTESEPGKGSPDIAKAPVLTSEPNPYKSSSVLHHYWHIGFVKGVDDKAKGIVTTRSNLCVYVCKWQNAETHDEMDAFCEGYKVGLATPKPTE